jgi:adenylylsulfate kinase-like enzyme
LTGVDAPYEEPEKPDLFFDTEQVDSDAIFMELMKYLNGKISGPLS